MSFLWKTQKRAFKFIGNVKRKTEGGRDIKQGKGVARRRRVGKTKKKVGGKRTRRGKKGDDNVGGGKTPAGQTSLGEKKR